MTTIQFVLIDDSKMIAALEAVKPFVRGAPKLFSPMELPTLPSSAVAFESRAQAIAKFIRPRDSQPMRAEALRAVLTGHDTWFDQKGEVDPALRNATGALSKALRRFAPLTDSPIEILCERRREVVATGPYKGRYQGTRYIPTKLGIRVREILDQMGVL